MTDAAPSATQQKFGPATASCEAEETNVYQDSDIPPSGANFNPFLPDQGQKSRTATERTGPTLDELLPFPKKAEAKRNASSTGLSRAELGAVVDAGKQQSTPAHKDDVRPASHFDQTVGFLSEIADNGLVALAAIVPDGPLSGRTFDLSAERPELTAWLEAHNGRANLYYTLNEPKPASDRVGAAGRLREDDVARIRGIAVDLDPDPNAAGEYEAERRRLLDVAATWSSNLLAPATAAIDSGNGVQLIWLFPEPLPNHPETRASVKAQAKALGRMLGSDSVQSVDHLFRLPGTVNLPNRKKREAGRTRTESRLLHFDRPATSTLKSLAVAAPPILETRAAAAVELSGFDYEAVSEAAAGEPLPAHLAAFVSEARHRKSVATALANGDRSERDFALAAYCVECGLMDPTEIGQVVFALSPERLNDEDGRGRGEWYAANTIRRALERTKPQPRAETWFSGATAPTPSPAPTPELRVVTGIVEAQGLAVRDWLVRPRLPIGDVTQCVGEPSIGKSTFAVRDALIVTTGREDLLRGKDAAGNPITYERLHRTGPAVIYNAEDRLPEMQKRLAAAQRHFGVAEGDMKHPIILWSGVDGLTLKVMARDSDRGPLKRAPGADSLEQVIRQYGAVFVCLDPQISLATGAVENSSEDQNDLLQELANMAARHKVNISVVHHTSKSTRDKAGDMGAGRGAFAAVAKVRSAYTITNVTGDGPGEKDWGVSPADRLVRLDMSKTTNDDKPVAPIVFKRVSAAVGNGTGRLPQGVEDLFGAPPQARLEAEGDFAPVIEVVDIKARAQAAKVDADGAQRAHAKEIAGMAFDLMGDRDQVRLSDVRDALGDLMRAARICKVTDRKHLTAYITAALGAGTEIDRDGAVVRVRVERIGRGPTAPWCVTRTSSVVKAGE